jgi:hypothetical protein
MDNINRSTGTFFAASKNIGLDGNIDELNIG